MTNLHVLFDTELNSTFAIDLKNPNRAVNSSGIGYPIQLDLSKVRVATTEETQEYASMLQVYAPTAKLY